MTKSYDSLETVNINVVGAEIEAMYTGTLSENTRRAYTRDIKDFFQVKEIRDVTLEKLGEVDVSTAHRLCEKLKIEGKAVSTINRKLTSLSSFYRFLSRREIHLVEYNPFDSYQGSKRLIHNKKYSDTRSLTTEEIKKIVIASSSYDNPLLSHRNKLIILLFVTTGVKREEIVEIKLKNFKVNMGKNTIEIIGKNNIVRFIVISERIMALIQSYLALRGMRLFDESFADAYLLVSHSYNTEGNMLNSQTIYNVIRYTAEKAGLDAETISPQILRQSFVTLSTQEGLDLHDISIIMGHGDLATTMRYLKPDRIISNHPTEDLTNKFM